MLIINARNPQHPADGAIWWYHIVGERIARIGRGTPHPDDPDIIDAHGAWAMPGGIDCHVHFRQPGMEHKATIASETRAAIAGGITSFIDMPNCRPTTTTIEAWQHKCDIAAADSLCNYAFFLGATNDNIDTLLRADYTRIPGVKVFMGSSTGNMLVDSDATLTAIFRDVHALVAVHAEDQQIIDDNARRAREQYGDVVPICEHSRIRSAEACVAATRRALEMARLHGTRLHICHISTAAEVDLLPADQRITAEVSPHHLLWNTTHYPAQGTRIKMNPAVKTPADTAALRAALADGRIAMVATDHAPHLLAEKQGDALTATSGAPMIQFSIPALLEIYTPAQVARFTAENPARTFGIVDRGRIAPGYFADIALVSRVEPYTVTDADVLSLCGWTPMAGTTLHHRVDTVIVNGTPTYRAGDFTHLRHPLPLRFAPNAPNDE